MESTQEGETSHTVRQRILHGREKQMARGNMNRDLVGKTLTTACALAEDDKKLMDTAMEKLGLSARAYHRILKVARTIADLDGSENILTAHLTEALSYRILDRRHI